MTKRNTTDRLSRCCCFQSQFLFLWQRALHDFPSAFLQINRDGSTLFGVGLVVQPKKDVHVGLVRLPVQVSQDIQDLPNKKKKKEIKEDAEESTGLVPGLIKNRGIDFLPK